MEQYHELSKRYLKFQKNRTLLTILGVAVASGALFVLLTLYFSNFINKRDAVRKERNYDMVFLIEDETVIADIVKQDYIKSVYRGTYYDSYSNENYDRALFINLKNPYRMNHYKSLLEKEYGVEGLLNDSLAGYYMQGDVGDMNYIILLMFLFLSVVFAIIGVGIIRNSIQLNTLEQVKDYGILRCVGATSGQLKRIIFGMGFYQEMAGMLLGIVLGFPVAWLIGYVSHIKVGFHLLPVFFVLVAFLGDLYFVMLENSKLVKKLTPVEAVRGNLAVKKRKLRHRRKSIFGLIFGMEGDYAYKSLKANKGRYYKSVFAFGLGITCFIGISVFSYSLNTLNKAFSRRFGDHQLYFVDSYMIGVSYDDIQTSMPSYRLLQQITEHENVESVKTVYSAYMSVVDHDAFLDKFNDKYLDDSLWGGVYDTRAMDSEDAAYYWMTSMNVIGYDADEYAKLEELLLEGTLDVGDDGIVVTKQALAYPRPTEEEEESGIITVESMYGSWYNINDYEIGDKVTFYDMERTQELFRKNCEEAGFGESLPVLYDDNGEPLYDKVETERLRKLNNQCIVRAYEQAYKEGAYREYTVKGIVKRDLDFFADTSMQAVVPLDNFLNMTGLKEGQSTGVKFALKEDKLDSKLENLLITCLDESTCSQSDYVFDIQAINTTRKTLRYVSMFVVFVVVMSSVNIVNTSASNLHLRRQELAQLRVVGVSKKRLTYIVMLEGIITVISANILGNVMGYGLLVPMKQAVNVMFHIPLTSTLKASVVGLLVSILILCGSIYIPIKRMGKDVVADLNASGD